MSTLDEYVTKFMAMPDEWSLEQWREVATDLAKEKDVGDQSRPPKKLGRPRKNKKSTVNYLLHLSNPEVWPYNGPKPRGRKRQLYYGCGIEVIAKLINILDIPIKTQTKRDRLKLVLKIMREEQGTGFHDIRSVERALRRYKRTKFKKN